MNIHPQLRVSSIPHITITYEWEALQEDDIGAGMQSTISVAIFVLVDDHRFTHSGVIAMFSITLLLTIMMVYFGGVLRQKKMSASEVIDVDVDCAYVHTIVAYTNNS